MTSAVVVLLRFRSLAFCIAIFRMRVRGEWRLIGSEQPATSAKPMWSMVRSASVASPGRPCSHFDRLLRQIGRHDAHVSDADTKQRITHGPPMNT